MIVTELPRRGDPDLRGLRWEYYTRPAKQIVLERMRGRHCVLALDQLRGLPKARNNTQACGVYFLWDLSFLVYVGKSVDIAYRLKCHLKDSFFFWTHGTYLNMREEFAQDFEALYIDTLDPPENRKQGQYVYLGNE